MKISEKIVQIESLINTWKQELLHAQELNQKFPNLQIIQYDGKDVFYDSSLRSVAQYFSCWNT